MPSNTPGTPERSHIPSGRRSGWHLDVRLALEELLVRLETEDPDIIERARIDAERRFSTEFPMGSLPGG